MEAAQEGSVEKCAQLATSAEEVNQQDDAGRTALLYAAGNGKMDVCTLLLERGAHLARREPKKRNALYHAALGGHAKLCRYFKEMGFEITPDECTELLPEIAKKGYAEVCRFLLENGAAGNFEKLMTEIQALLEPAQRKRLTYVEGWASHITYQEVTPAGRQEVIRLLNVCNQLLKSIYEEACSVEHVQQMIAQGAVLNARDAIGRSPLFIAIARKNRALSSYFIACGADVRVLDHIKRSCMHLTAEQGDLETCTELLSKGAPIDIKLDTPSLGTKFLNGRTPLLEASENGHLAITSVLLSAGSDVNASNNGRTPLIAAAANGHTDICELLMSKGAQVNAQDAEGWTPLLSACIPATGRTSSKQLNVPLITLLIHAGAEVNVAAPTSWDRGWTPLMAAAIHGELELCRSILDRGADLTMCSASPFQHTALEWAIIFGKLDVIKLLIERGSSLEAHKKPEDNALGLAKAVGLKEDNKEKFKPIIKLIKESIKENICHICFVNQAETIVPCPAKHKTCSRCWTSWASQNKGCPFCRG